ncbi:MAG: DNA-3-methyladenine glycosylase 2 family protein [Actinobacteria bacterium]|nr:DNA-3-methyladenine glycosylase 2 family protein [Actinomycetota bacterium]MBI3686274.1 DNA-3-methyladenine glycosylase 2 family protein [Actinomycetota bacterium]
MLEDFESCYRAVASRDRRFDGRFVTAVTSTGIYCRPSCPAQTPKPANVRFYRVPGAAQAAGFRACRRCLPDATPGSPEWDVRADLAARALRLIADGAADAGGVTEVARRLAVSERHLHRTLVAEVGAGPLALARTRRAQTARLLVESSAMPLADVAFAAGFGSIRQFNDEFRAAFGRTPSQARLAAPAGPEAGGPITLRLRHRPPYQVGALLRWYAARAVPGLETVSGGSYRRTLRLPHGAAFAELTPDTDASQVRLYLTDLRDLTPAVQRCRRLLDTDADPDAVASILGTDRRLAPLIAAGPGLRVPGAADGFELAVRAVLGQQVTVAGARTICGRLVSALGEPLPAPAFAPAGTMGETGEAAVWRLFPTAGVVAEADLSQLGLPRTRQGTLRALAAAVGSGAVTLDPGADRHATDLALRALPGIGPWTAGYVAMRALGDPDALPAGDLGLRRAAATLGITDLAGCAERWRPWRAYAAMYLWNLPNLDHERREARCTCPPSTPRPGR